jgi:hypothetical protein
MCAGSHPQSQTPEGVVFRRNSPRGERRGLDFLAAFRACTAGLFRSEINVQLGGQGVAEGMRRSKSSRVVRSNRGLSGLPSW